MFNPHPGAGLVTLTYHYYPNSSGNPPSSWAAPSDSAPAAPPPPSAPALPSLPKGEKPNVEFFEYLARLVRSYRKPSLFSSKGASSNSDRQELESTFLAAIQSILYTSPSLIKDDPKTREVILQTLYLCRKAGLNPQLCLQAGFQVLEEWHGELVKKEAGLVKRRDEGLKEEREDLRRLRIWTSSYAGAGWGAGDPYVRRERELMQEILKEEAELRKEEKALEEEKEGRYERVQREYGWE